MSFLERPIGEMDLEELVRLMKQVISQEVPPIPAGLALLDDQDNPLIPPDGAVQAEALVYNAETGKWENGRITANSLEADLVLATSIIAGDPESTHVAMGTVTHDGSEMVGIHAFESDGMTVSFMLDAMSGDVFMKGRVQFGDSWLIPTENVVELMEQSSAGLQTPTRVQSVNSGSTTSGPTASVTWGSNTQPGSLLVAALYINDTDGTVPTPTTPAGWTLAESQVAADSDNALYVYYMADADAQSGAQAVTLNDSCRWMMTIYEYAGVSALDATTNTENLSQTTHAADAITSTQAGLIMAISAFYREVTNNIATDTPSAWSADLEFLRENSMSSAPFKHISVTHDFVSPGADTVDIEPVTRSLLGGDITGECDSLIILLAFQAKPATGSPTPPEADKARLYAADMGGETKLFELNDLDRPAQVSGPTGAVMAFAGGAAPDGWLLCDGASLLRTDYPALYDVIGTTYGAADGTHFNVPDLEGRIPVGIDAGQTEFDTRGETGGAKTHTLTQDEIPSHDHTPPTNFDRFLLRRTSGGGSLAAPGAGTAYGLDSTTGVAGGGDAHNNLQPYMALHYIIKV